MAIQYPITIDELKNCQKVGQGKAQKFGQEFVDLIKQHIEINGIDRPEDLVIKSVGTSSESKRMIIRNIDSRMSLDDIADGMKMTLMELIEQLETFVDSGTTINIDYYLNSILDEADIDDIYTYFREDSENGTIDEALQEFGDDYSEEEIRLVRLKFICEMGN